MKGDWLLSVTSFETGQIDTGHVLSQSVVAPALLSKPGSMWHQSHAVTLTGINNNDLGDYETGPRVVISGIRDWLRDEAVYL